MSEESGSQRRLVELVLDAEVVSDERVRAALDQLSQALADAEMIVEDDVSGFRRDIGLTSIRLGGPGSVLSPVSTQFSVCIGNAGGGLGCGLYFGELGNG